jgi:sulfonate transport system permease protein
MTKRPWYAFVLSVVLLFAIVALWNTATTHRWVSPVYLPTPLRAWLAIVDGFRNDGLLPRILLTLEHIFLGWVIASTVGIVLGSMIGMSRQARIYLGPTLEFFRPLPPVAIFPIAIVLFGLSETMVIGVIAFGALWSPLLATIHGFATLKPRLFEVRDLLKMPRLAFALKIALPHAAPEIIAGMRLSLTISLVLSVTGEMLSSSEGLGFWVMVQSRSFRTDSLFAGVLLFGLIGYSLSQLMSLLQSYLLKWRIR